MKFLGSGAEDQSITDQNGARPVSYERLLRMAHRRVLDGKAGLAASIAKMCLDRRSELSERELELTYEILRLLIDRVEMDVKRFIADYLCERMDVPENLLSFLANQTVHVAYPIILRSQQLSDAGLIDIVNRKGRGHALVIAERNDLSEVVSGRLVSTRDRDVGVALLKNQSARIGRKAYETLVDDSVEFEPFQALLTKRPDLPVDLARRMYVWVSDILKVYIAQNFEIDAHIAEDAADDALMRGLDAHDWRVDDSDPEGGSRPSWSEAERNRRNRAIRLLRALQRRGKPGFLTTFVAESGLPTQATTALFNEGPSETMAIACRALGMDVDGFLSVADSFRKPDPGRSLEAAEELERLAAYFERIEGASAERVLKRWVEDAPEHWH